MATPVTRGQKAAQNVQPSQPPKKTTRDITYEQVLLEDNDLKKYLELEFIDDKGILAKYLQELFPEAKKPSEMKREIDTVDTRVKAYYLLTLLQFDVNQTQLKSKDTRFSELSAADFASSGRNGKIQRIVNFFFQGKWPYAATTNFVFNDTLLKTVYQDEVIPRVSKLFQGKTRIMPEGINDLIIRLSSYYGLQRYPFDQIEKAKNPIPRADEKASFTNEGIVENNVFRFALFGSPNYQDKLVFTNNQTNRDTLLYAFNDGKFIPNSNEEEKKTTFGRADFPESIAKAALPFFEKAAIVVGYENIGAGLKNYLNKYSTAKKMSAPAEKKPNAEPTPYGAIPAQTDDPQKAAALAAAAAEEAKKVAAAQKVVVEAAAEPAPEKAVEQPAPEKQAVADAVAAAVANVAAPVELSSDCKDFTAELGNYATHVTDLDTTLKTYVGASDSASILIKNQQDLIRQLLQLRKGTSSLQSDQSKLLKDLDDCRKKTRDLEAQIQQLTTNAEEFRKQIAAFEAQQGPLKEYIKQLLAAINGHEDKLRQIDSLKKRIETLADVNEKAQVDKLTQELNERADEIRAVIADLEAKLKDAQPRLAEFEKRIVELEAQLKECVDNREKAQTGIIAEGGKKSELEKELKKCQDNTAALVKKYSDFCVEQAEALKRVNADLKRVTSSIANPLKNLNDIVAKAREELAAATAQASENVNAPVQVVVEDKGEAITYPKLD